MLVPTRSRTPSWPINERLSKQKISKLISQNLLAYFARFGRRSRTTAQTHWASFSGPKRDLLPLPLLLLLSLLLLRCTCRGYLNFMRDCVTHCKRQFWCKRLAGTINQGDKARRCDRKTISFDECGVRGSDLKAY